ncbi:hypothetical protein L3X38_043357 [Prunus dulcis]|uniref:Uncharacterized protein n=1 Tax=Prunus dulcis TaxID=3755 RepID=A0AAD4YM26_PRUDU|nr:hypothetical protein L3X38_043357 [Prunus dulcis]
MEHTPTSKVQPLYLSYKPQPHFPESQASASTPQFIEVEVQTETDVGELGNQFVVGVGLDDDADDEAHEFADEFPIHPFEQGHPTPTFDNDSAKTIF